MPAYSLFVHSTGTGPTLWRSVPEHAYAGTIPLFASNLGYPPQPPLPRGQQLTALDDARHLLTQIPADATSLRVFGHSYGGLVALRVSKLSHVPVESLFLVEPVLFGALVSALDEHPEARGEVEGLQSRTWFLDDAHGGTAAWLEVFIDYWNRPGSWARMPPVMQEAQLTLGWKMYQEVRSVFLDAGSFSEWRLDPNVPLTLAVGDRTTASAKAMVAGLAAQNPHARVVELAGAGHMAIAVKPQLVWDALA